MTSFYSNLIHPNLFLCKAHLTSNPCIPQLHWVPDPNPVFIQVALTVVEVKLPRCDRLVSAAGPTSDHSR